MKKLFCVILSYIVWKKRSPPSLKAAGFRVREFPYQIQVIADNLYVPWAIAISDEDKLYFTERSGAVRVIEEGRLLSEPLITFGPPFISQSEGGLMGIVLDPDFLQNRYLYVMHSYRENAQIYNRVVRLVEQNNKAEMDKVLLDSIPGGRIHNGGRLKLGPDQKLYITAGDAAVPALAQDVTSMAGKILRIERDGSIPEDNPISGSPIYSFGHRNPQGLAWNEKNVLYASEHGPIAYDEINIIEAGGNYGWPITKGDQTSSEINGITPLVHSGQETWAPSGIAFVTQGPWQGKLLVATLRGSRLLVFSLNEEGTEVVNIESWLQNEYGRLREVVEAKDGSIYLTTSNRDGRGNPVAADDRIIRLMPKELQY